MELLSKLCIAEELAMNNFTSTLPAEKEFLRTPDQHRYAGVEVDSS